MVKERSVATDLKERAACASAIRQQMADPATKAALPLEERGFGSLSTCPDDQKVRFLKTAQRATTSKTAGIKLKCLDCVAWQPEEVRRCHIEDCTLWRFRPYR